VLVPAAIRTARREITHSPEREVPTSVKRHLVIAAVIAACLVFATSALAATIYVGPRYWSCFCDASSSYSSNWYWNDFYKTTSGVSDTMVTLIDNGAFGYSWHGTVRSTAKDPARVLGSRLREEGLLQVLQRHGVQRQLRRRHVSPRRRKEPAQ
jgi:hypothetical protein